MYEDYIGIKVNKSTPIAKIYPILKKYREISISELKKDIDSHNYLIKGKYTNRIDVKIIIDCFYKLKTIGVTAELYELDGEASTISFFENLNKTYDEISDEIDSCNETNS